MNVILRSVVFWVFFFCVNQLFAQKNFTVSGTIRDAKTGEELIGAIVQLKDTNGIGTVTNAYGFYSLTVPAASHQLAFRYVGYDEQTVTLDSAKNQTINISLGIVSKSDGRVPEKQLCAKVFGW